MAGSSGPTAGRTPLVEADLPLDDDSQQAFELGPADGPLPADIAGAALPPGLFDGEPPAGEAKADGTKADGAKTDGAKTDGAQGDRADDDRSGGDGKPHYLGHRKRLRARFLRGGTAALEDYELIELLLAGAKPRGDMKPLAKTLLSRFGNLAGVVSASVGELDSVDGMGEASIAALKLVRAAAERLAREEVMHRPVLGAWNQLLDYCRIAMAREKVEQLRLMFLDRRNALIADEVQQRGTIDHTPVYPREVIKRALELNATALILVHNHPSGDPTPSRADVDMTREIAAAGQPLGIHLHDHLVIGRTRHFSFRSKGVL